MEIAGTSLDSLAFWRPDQSLEKARNVATSIAASSVRAWSGNTVGTLGPRPVRPLILFEKEACPYSRLVREALSILDIDADMRPCPDGEEVHEKELEALGGKQIPYLVDPNQTEALSESLDIVQYLFEKYGDGRVPLTLRGPLAIRSSKLASRIRGHRGNDKRAARRPSLELELFGYEAGPHTRLVREQLSALGLPWVYRTRAHHSPRRFELEAELGPLSFPYLRDKNTGRSLRESDIIVAYLETTYARG
jgi:glutathione S-transferase